MATYSDWITTATSASYNATASGLMNDPKTSVPALIKTLIRLGFHRSRKKQSTNLKVTTEIEITDYDMESLMESENASQVEEVLQVISKKIQKDWLDKVKAQKILHKLLKDSNKERKILQYKSKIPVCPSLQVTYGKTTDSTNITTADYKPIIGTDNGTTGNYFAASYQISPGNSPGTYNLSRAGS